MLRNVRNVLKLFCCEHREHFKVWLTMKELKRSKIVNYFKQSLEIPRNSNSTFILGRLSLQNSLPSYLALLMNK